MAKMDLKVVETRIREFVDTLGQVRFLTRNSIYELSRIDDGGFGLKKLSDNPGGTRKPNPGQILKGTRWEIVPEGGSFLVMVRNGDDFVANTSRVRSLSVSFE